MPDPESLPPAGIRPIPERPCGADGPGGPIASYRGTGLSGVVAMK
jgi:hypothetical protein